jgi:hypothetical protein
MHAIADKGIAGDANFDERSRWHALHRTGEVTDIIAATRLYLDGPRGTAASVMRATGTGKKQIVNRT